MPNTYRGYGLTSAGTATPISDPGAYQRGEVVEMAADSQMLGGVAAASYALKSDIGETDGITMELVWENSSPYSEFAAQTVSMDLSSYDMVLVIAIRAIATSNRNTMTSEICKLGMSANLTYFYNWRQARLFTVSATGIQFEDSYNAALGELMAKANDSNVPFAVYGIKGIKTEVG